MKRVVILVLLAALIGGGAYWYRTAYSKCRVPIYYDIGFVDERFGISRDEVRAVVSDAESLWENATGKNLFTYKEEGGLAVNFLFDDRQEVTKEERGLREILDQKEHVSESIKEMYDEMVSEYNELKASYEERVAVYENKLATHNGEVAYWNTKGGAPEDVYERLNSTQRELADEREDLSGLMKELNGLVDAINDLGEQGNDTIEEYNQGVERYNDRFNQEREFTQGDYRGNEINIYQFDDQQELRLVLAHEFGHALSLDHVEGEQSVMYFLMEGQNTYYALTDADLAEFDRVCGSD